MKEENKVKNTTKAMPYDALLATVNSGGYRIKYNIGQTVYLRTDADQLERLITGINIRPNGISYALTNGTNESYHYDFEITFDRDIIKATSS